MQLDRLVLIIFCVIAAAGGTIWAGALLFSSLTLSPVLGMMVLSVLALGAYILWRVVAERVNNPEEDHYDGIEK